MLLRVKRLALVQFLLRSALFLSVATVVLLLTWSSLVPWVWQWRWAEERLPLRHVLDITARAQSDDWQQTVRELAADAPPGSPALLYRQIGRLGNWLVIYSTLYGWKRRCDCGLRAFLSPSLHDQLSSSFPHLLLPPLPRQLAAETWLQVEYRQLPRLLELVAGKRVNMYVYTYPSSNGMDVFHPYYSDLRQQLRFSRQLQDQAQQTIWTIRRENRLPENTTYIGFHVRRTDFVEYLKDKYHIDTPGELYYSGALQYFRQRYPSTAFLISTDDVEYVRREILPTARDVFLMHRQQPGLPVADLATLAACNHSVITVGTFGFWSGYLAPGEFVAPALNRPGEQLKPHLLQRAGFTRMVLLPSS